MSSVFYIGFKNLIINLENFSYLLLLISFLFNTTLFLLLTFLDITHLKFLLDMINKIKKFIFLLITYRLDFIIFAKSIRFFSI